jgi:hypothetical protein
MSISYAKSLISLLEALEANNTPKPLIFLLEVFYVYRISNASNGQLTFRRPNNRGQRFTIRLTCSAAMKSEPSSPTTLGSVAKADLRLIVWCRGSGHQVKPDPARLAQRHGADSPVLNWRWRVYWASPPRALG